MDESGDLRLASLLASRLCHDLVGPLGAVDNGLELMAENGEMAGEAMALAQRSARRATGRLQLFRFAFGAAGGEEHFGPGEARALAMECLQNGTIQIHWPAAMELPPGAARLLLNLLLLGSECLPRGGRLEVERTATGVAVLCEGAQIRLLPEVKAAVEGSAELAALSPRTVVGHYAQRLAKTLGWQMRIVEDGPGKLRLEAANLRPA
jgi:histidine phosphotransferase ChpT